MRWLVKVEMHDRSTRTAEVQASNKEDAGYRACYKIESEPRRELGWEANKTNHVVSCLRMSA